MQRRTFILILFAIILTMAVGAFVIYRNLFPTKITTAPNNTSGGTNPFGESGNVPGQTQGTNGSTSGGEATSTDSTGVTPVNPTEFDIKKLSETPVSGIGFRYDKYLVSSTSTKPVYATSTSILFIEQGTGHVVQYKPNDGTSRKISTTRVPGIYESFIPGNGTVAVVRRVSEDTKQIQTIILNLPTTDSLDTETSGTFLPENIVSITSKNNSLFYVAKTNTGSNGYTYDLKTKKTSLILESPVTSWLANWNSKLITLTTKPSGNTAGFSYTLDSSKNSLKKVFGPKDGLGVLFSQKGDYVVVSESSQGSGTTYLASGTSTQKIAGDITSVAPDKCVWVPDGTLALCAGFTAFNNTIPDDWYKGTLSTRDNLYVFNTYFRSSDLFLNLDAKNLDMANLKISDDGQYLVFINKKDYTPWIIKLADLLAAYTRE